MLESFGFPGRGNIPPAPAPAASRLNTLVPAMATPEPADAPITTDMNAPTAPAPAPTGPTETPPPTMKPTLMQRPQHAEIGEGDGTTPVLQQAIALMKQGAEQMEPLFGANHTYKLEDFLKALEWTYEWETGASKKKTNGEIDGYPTVSTQNGSRHLQDARKVMELGGERLGGAGNLKYAMAHVALILGTAWHAGFHTGMCDEPNHNATDEQNPGCGQDGLNYRYPFDGFAEEGFGCFQNDQEWASGVAAGCAVQPTAVDIITSDAKEPERLLQCGQGLDNIFSRDCCWWGRGMMQMTHQCDYGDYQANWGNAEKNAVPEERPPTDLCGNPGQVCSDDFPELRFMTGLYLWVRDVVHAEDPTFNFMQELKEWVDGKMDMRKYGNFVDRIGAILQFGDPTRLPEDYRARRNTVEFALDTVMSLAPIGVFPTYGNIGTLILILILVASYRTFEYRHLITILYSLFYNSHVQAGCSVQHHGRRRRWKCCRWNH